MIRVYLLLGENTLSTSSSRPIFDRERLYPARGWKPDYGAWRCVAFPHFLAYIQGLRVDENVRSRP